MGWYWYVDCSVLLPGHEMQGKHRPPGYHLMPQCFRRAFLSSGRLLVPLQQVQGGQQDRAGHPDRLVDVGQGQRGTGVQDQRIPGVQGRQVEPPSIPVTGKLEDPPIPVVRVAYYSRLHLQLQLEKHVRGKQQRLLLARSYTVAGTPSCISLTGRRVMDFASAGLSRASWVTTTTCELTSAR